MKDRDHDKHKSWLCRKTQKEQNNRKRYKMVFSFNRQQIPCKKEKKITRRVCEINHCYTGRVNGKKKEKQWNNWGCLGAHARCGAQNSIKQNWNYKEQKKWNNSKKKWGWLQDCYFDEITPWRTSSVPKRHRQFCRGLICINNPIIPKVIPINRYSKSKT